MTAADQGAGAPPPPPPPQAGGTPPQAPRAARQAPAIPPWEIVVMASGALMLIFSFLAFYKVDETDFTEGESWSAWSNALNLFPLATLVVIFGVLLAAAVAAARFGNVSLPEGVAGFTLPELRLVVGVLGTLTLLTHLIRTDTGADKGIGLIITTLACAGLLVGALMERQGGSVAGRPAASSGGGGGQPSPGSLLVMGAGVLILIGSFLAVVKSGDDSRTAWGAGFFPIYTLPAILGALMAAHVAITEFTGARLPSSVLGLSWSKIHLALGGWAALTMICLLVGRVFVEGADITKGVGFWLMLVAAIGLVVGAVMREQEGSRPAAPAPAGAPPPPPPPPA